MTATLPTLAAYLHPVFPWEEADGSINYAYLVMSLVVVALVVAGFVYLVVKLFRRLR